jgi:hypothetical protein
MIEEKIAKFRELLARRDEIDAEIRAILGETTAPPETSAPQQRRPKQPGGFEEYKHRQKGEPCTECGSKGARHFNTCSQSGVAKKKLLRA